eukprot:scaffold582_cov385-Prasinococcus_capsulatus_cf.AAC.40
MEFLEGDDDEEMLGACQPFGLFASTASQSVHPSSAEPQLPDEAQPVPSVQLDAPVPPKRAAPEPRAFVHEAAVRAPSTNSDRPGNGDERLQGGSQARRRKLMTREDVLRPSQAGTCSPESGSKRPDTTMAQQLSDKHPTSGPTEEEENRSSSRHLPRPRARFSSSPAGQALEHESGREPHSLNEPDAGAAQLLPGPAGRVQRQMLQRETHIEEDSSQAHARSARESHSMENSQMDLQESRAWREVVARVPNASGQTVAVIKENVNLVRIPELLVLIKAMKFAAKSEEIATLMDGTGTIDALVHRPVVDRVEGFTEGAIVLLKKVRAQFAVRRSHCKHVGDPSV